MSRWTPCKRSDFIRRLRALGFRGPPSGTRHQFMVYGTHRLTVPSNVEYSVPQLKLMLREVETIMGRQLSLDEWDAWRKGHAPIGSAADQRQEPHCHLHRTHCSTGLSLTRSVSW